MGFFFVIHLKNLGRLFCPTLYIQKKLQNFGFLSLRIIVLVASLVLYYHSLQTDTFKIH